jgi:hypothetical protein
MGYSDDGILSFEAVSSMLLLLACEVKLLDILGEWFTICRIRWIISPMPLSSDTSRSSIEGIAALASDQVDALSWNRSVVSGSSHSSL